jgi:hypothetical protein
MDLYLPLMIQYRGKFRLFWVGWYFVSPFPFNPLKSVKKGLICNSLIINQLEKPHCKSMTYTLKKQIYEK